MDYGPSQQGSLLIALGADVDTSIDEFASIPVQNFNTLETVWLHSESTEPDDHNSQDLAIKPSEIVKARARSAHHVARIWIGAETTRAYKTRRLNHDDNKSQEYRDAKLAALQAAAVGPGTARPPTTDVGETVPINEVADTTQKRGNML